MQNAGNESWTKTFLKNKWVKAILAIDVIAILTIIGISIWNATKTVTLTLNVTPIDAKIQVGSATYQNGTYRLHPGTYDIVISRDGLDSKTFTLDFAAHHSITFSVFLKSGSDDLSFYEHKDNYPSYQKLSEIAGKDKNQTYDHDASAETFVADFDKNYKLMQEQLPINYYDYRDDPNASPRYATVKDISITRGISTECEKTLCLQIKNNITDDKDFAEKLLKEKGFDLNLFEVQHAGLY